MNVSTVAVVARSAGVLLQVRVDERLKPLSDRALGEIAHVVDVLAGGPCEMCGHDLEDHVVTPGPFGNPFLYCEKGGN